MVDGQTIAILVVGIIIGIAIFIALREFWCWFWKINEIRNLLRQILHRLESSAIDSGIKEEDLGIKGEPIPKAIVKGREFKGR